VEGKSKMGKKKRETVTNGTLLGNEGGEIQFIGKKKGGILSRGVTGVYTGVNGLGGYHKKMLVMGDKK